MVVKTNHDTAIKSLVVGITGGIGSGKSLVGRFWSSYYDLPLIDLDVICRQLVRKGESGWNALRSRLGTSYFQDNEELDRQRLRSAIFNDFDLRRQVDQLIHPLALQGMRCELVALTVPLVLVDVPLLFEAGWQDEFQNIVVVFADQKTCCRRIVQRDGVSGEEALQTIRSQAPLFDKALSADHVIDNRGYLLDTKMQTLHLAGLFNSFVLEKVLDRRPIRQY